MKRKLLAPFCMLGILLAFTFNGKAQSRLIHYWHFDNLVGTYYDRAGCPDSIPAIAADYSTLDTSKAKMLYMKQPGVSSSWPTVANEGVAFTYLDPLAVAVGTPDYDTVNLRMGESSGNAFRTRNPSDSMELRFYIPAWNYQNLVLKYGCERSGSGMLHNLYDYSLDSGSSWSTTGLPMTTDSIYPTFTLHTISFGAIIGSAGNGRLVFRIRFSGNNNTSNGNDRFDNVTLEGDTLITNSIGQVIETAAVTISPNPVVNSLEISTATDGAKTVCIYNTIGQVVYSGIESGKQCSINVAALEPGNYFARISENSTGKTSTVKFSKQ